MNDHHCYHFISIRYDMGIFKTSFELISVIRLIAITIQLQQDIFNNFSSDSYKCLRYEITVLICLIDIFIIHFYY